ncbi:hypothetical protein MLGJGCBP_08112 [Rhodococcus sp. T7]|nr:hypothetical protein MLGJGCBP_08112 [Rhodococcus sp. T7]
MSVSDGGAERSVSSPYGIDVNPLVVTRRVSERVDLLLGDGVP